VNTQQIIGRDSKNTKTFWREKYHSQKKIDILEGKITILLLIYKTPTISIINILKIIHFY
jgi:hypothetical protein